MFGLNRHQSIRNPVGQHHSFQLVECIVAFVGEVPPQVFLGESCQRDHNIRVSMDELVIEISKAKEGLNVLHFAWFRPILDCLDFCGVHT